MNTPICDFVENYAKSGTVRMHMPGHKGRGAALACGGASRDCDGATDGMNEVFSRAASYDITEITGADELFRPMGIIAESEKNASELFGCPTFYSTEGSSLCIRAMLHLCLGRAKSTVSVFSDSSSVGKTASAARFHVLAARNCHFAFLSAAVLLDLDVDWLSPKGISNLSLELTADDVRAALEDMTAGAKNADGRASADKPICVYITTPDYLGHMLDVSGIAKVCHEFGVPLVVDNAHGAYLRFLAPSLHPMDLGADLCCDSAHKTLPVLTGGAYLHVREDFAPQVKDAMALFASTSPSWLIMQSLDLANAWLFENGKAAFSDAASKTLALRESLSSCGLRFYGEEPMKLTLLAGAGDGAENALAEFLRAQKIEPEFTSSGIVVLMTSPFTMDEDFERLSGALKRFGERAGEAAGDSENAVVRTEVAEESEAAEAAEKSGEALFEIPEKQMTIRDAALAPWEIVPTEEALGRVAAMDHYACPPAVPIVMPGEVIGKAQVAQLLHYGYDSSKVVRR